LILANIFMAVPPDVEIGDMPIVPHEVIIYRIRDGLDKLSSSPSRRKRPPTRRTRSLIQFDSERWLGMQSLPERDKSMTHFHFHLLTKICFGPGRFSSPEP
jgi:hypothetical protein